MVKAVVIGANGFLGSHLVDALSAAGHVVTAFDRFSSEFPTYTAKGVRRIVGDFQNRSDIRTAVDGQDVVFHFLSATSPATADSDPSLDVSMNIAPTIQLLEASVEAGISRCYYASTGGAIYGNQGKSTYSETDRTLPVSPYGIGKLAIENYLEFFRARHGLTSTILRISNPYGPRQHPNKRQGLIPIVLRQLQRGLPVVRMGDGSMVRDYLFVGDLVQMIVSMAAAETHRFGTYNLGSGVGHSINEVLDTIRTVTRRDFEVETVDAPSTYVDRVVLDVARFTAEFGVYTSTSLTEGIHTTFVSESEHPSE